MGNGLAQEAKRQKAERGRSDARNVKRASRDNAKRLQDAVAELERRLSHFPEYLGVSFDPPAKSVQTLRVLVSKVTPEIRAEAPRELMGFGVQINEVGDVRLGG